MKKPFLTLAFIGISAVILAQGTFDSLQQKIDLVSEKVNFDSLQPKLPQLPDSLLPSFQKVDSIRTAFIREGDSIKTQYQNAVSEIGSQTQKINRRIDSLQHLNLSADRYTKKSDSLRQVLTNTEAKFTTKLDSLKSKTTDKLNALDLPPEYKEPLQQLTKNVGDLNLNSDIIKIPSLEIPGYSLPKIEGIGDLTSKAGEIGNMGDIPDIGNVGNLPEIKTPAGDLGQITEQAKGYQDDLKNITQGDLDDVQELPKTIEDQAAKIDGVQELQKQSGVVDGYKDKLDNLNDPKAAKEKAVTMAKEAAVDHFAGKQEQLKAAMEKIAKYKQKYSSVSSIKDLPKRPPNPMKDKPFVERLVPGVYLQYQQKNYYLIDVNPYVGYKLTGRFMTGLGWNHRYAYDKRQHSWNQRSRIFGPRGYVDFKLGKGFIAHLEGEVMNTFIPSTLFGNPDTGHREWVKSVMVGMKKEYKIYKNLKGTVLIQYNLFNPHHKAPYVDRLNSRIGFEYVIKRKAISIRQ